MINSLKRNLLNIPGWSTKRKIVVFESDDWGSIRMPSSKTFDKLSQLGIDLTTGDSWRFNKFDTLASANDLEALFATLRKHRDKYGKPAVFTALSLVANPDFDKIRREKFTSYFFEPLPITLEKYYPHQNVMKLWRQGIDESLFFPQFHGREHLNVHEWLTALQNRDAQTLHAFDENMWGFNNSSAVSYQAAFDFNDVSEIEEHKSIIHSGLDLFESLFGYRATFFVPPNALMSEACHETLKKEGIKYLFGTRMYPIPLGKQRLRKKLLFTGSRNREGLTYVIRNAFFEPSQGDPSCVDKCLNDISLAFRWRKPAVISTHRVNFIGSLVEKNRTNGLNQLDELLTQITRRWPDVEFMSSSALGQLIVNGREARN